MATVKSDRVVVKPSENMTAKELTDFMTKEGLSKEELSVILGVTSNAVMFWMTDQRPMSVTTTRIIRLLKKYPTLIREF